MTDPASIAGVDVVRLATPIGRLAGYAVHLFRTRGALIDTGFPRAARAVAHWLDRWRPVAAALTHAHEDHAGNAGLVLARGIPLGMSPATAAVLRAPARVPLYRHLVWGTPAPLPPAALPSAPDAAGALPAGLALLPAPGHAPDHHVVWDAERGHLFGGDLFLGTRVRVAHPWEDLRALEQSLRRAAALRPSLLFDAHRGVVRDPVPRLLAKADWLAETIGRIEQLAAAGLAPAAIARRVLGREGVERWVSGGEYSRRMLVEGVLRGRG